MKRVLTIIFIVISFSGLCQTFLGATHNDDQSRQNLGGVGEEIKALPPIPDSIIIHKKDIAMDIAKDTLGSIQESRIEDTVLEPPLKQKADSVIAHNTASIAKKNVKDSIDNYLGASDVKLDSTTINQIKVEAKTQAKAVLEDKAGQGIPDIIIDSTTMSQVKEEVVRRAENAVKGTGQFKSKGSFEKSQEINELMGYKDKLAQTQEEIAQAAAKQKVKQKLATHVKEYITQHAGKIQSAQSNIGKLKKKYAHLPNSNDLGKATKRSSLEGESLWKRTVIGGNFTIGKTNPLSIDVSPVIGYKFNKLFEVGITGIYRTQFKTDKHGINAINDKVYGYSIFANHTVFENFFGYLEGERMSAADLYSSENPEREWKQTLLVGLGRKFNVAKWLQLQPLVLINILHDNHDGLHNSPVVFKTAVRLRK